MRRSSLQSLLLALLLLPLLPTGKTASAKSVSDGPVPVTHIMVCCRSANAGTKFLVGDRWDPAHDYSDIEVCRGIFQNIKDAGINIVSVDFTNPSMWNTGDVPGEPQLWTTFEPMLDNIIQVCKEKNMQFFLFLGDPGAWTFQYWNRIAGQVLEKCASLPVYRKYGYGDNRPMLVMFWPGQDFWPAYNALPAKDRNNLDRFRIGTTQVNDPILPTPSDGWGYRNYSSASDGSVRFVCPNSGVPPQDWNRIDAQTWRKRVHWALKATEYSVIGSYDDTCDSIFWGIADVSESTKGHIQINRTTVNDPYAYYNIVKEEIAAARAGKKDVVPKFRRETTREYKRYVKDSLPALAARCQKVLDAAYMAEKFIKENTNLPGYEGYPVKLYEYHTGKDVYLGKPKKGLVYMLNPDAEKLAKWIITSVWDVTGALNYDDIEAVRKHILWQSGAQFPVSGVVYEAMYTPGFYEPYVFKDGVTVYIKDDAMRADDKTCTEEQLQFYLSIKNSDLKPDTGRYARICSTNREMYKLAGGEASVGRGADGLRSQLWLDTVRNLYLQAWNSDYNFLIYAWAKYNLSR